MSSLKLNHGHDLRYLFFRLYKLFDKLYDNSIVLFVTNLGLFVIYLNISLINTFVQAWAAAGTVSQNYANILLMLLRLRQACDHPLLVKGFSSESVSRFSTKMAKNLPQDMRVNLLNLLEDLSICCLCSVSFTSL